MHAWHLDGPAGATIAVCLALGVVSQKGHVDPLHVLCLSGGPVMQCSRLPNRSHARSLAAILHWFPIGSSGQPRRVHTAAQSHTKCSKSKFSALEPSPGGMSLA